MKKVAKFMMLGTVLGGVALQAVSASAESQVGTAKVTYNANIIPPAPDEDSDFAVLIPSGYALSDEISKVDGEVKMVDANDFSKDYAKTAKIDVKVASTNGFKFLNNHGEYKLVDDSDANVSTFEMKAGSTSKKVNAKLTKKADNNKADFDTLNFSYVIK
ncbi:hypothetical protein [Lactococcus garvieae]|uniref:Cell surface protein n=1 Tax=Lactococcus garvieae TaxID=1363 RepID=A0A1I4J3S0_9LACT|nr:hypothetical protein [Lactococcus garvieae]SFL61268.1 hypothetical protein SAMN05216438_1302 [Lactococcus garvieae]